MKISVDFHDLDIKIKGIAAMGGGFPRYIDDVLFRCMNLDLYPQWVKQISMNDHTLQDLASLGHPYAVRYGKDSFVHPDDVVHIQDGNLLGGSKIEKSAVGNGYDLVNSSPEYVFLRYGTSKMRMRDPGGAAFQEALPAIKQRFAQEVRDAVVQFITR